MNPKITQFFQNYHGGTFSLLANVVVILCVVVVFMAVLIDFMEYHQTKKVKTRVRSWVETGSMFGYYLFYYVLIRAGIGHIVLKNLFFRHSLIVFGLIIIVIGCYVNVAGRLKLKHNWANQVTIYADQTLVTYGVYRIVRHPLYASILWMFFGGCLVYTNYIACLSIALIFIPMMVYRARQEERVLSSEFEGYREYKQHVGMFFPKLLKL